MLDDRLLAAVTVGSADVHTVLAEPAKPDRDRLVPEW